eukprot:5065818-Pleurochrysis_carterae.AAC.2
MPLVGGKDLNGTASGDPTDLRFNRPYRASPTGYRSMGKIKRGEKKLEAAKQVGKQGRIGDSAASMEAELFAIQYTSAF